METSKITRRMDKVLLKYKEKMCNKEDMLSRIAVVEKEKYQSVISSRMAALYEMLDIAGLEYKKGESLNYYKELVNKSDIPGYKGMIKRIIVMLYEEYEKYPTPSVYMKRIVDRLSCKEDGVWKNEPLRVRILKQFIKYGNSLKDAGYGGRNFARSYAEGKSGKKLKNSDAKEIAQYVDDGIFEVLDTASKDDKKYKGKYGIIELADELAAGRFKSGGATKRGLYMFAMAYKMTFGGDERTDIEKNLFTDYYNNNIMRFVMQEYQDNNGSLEIEPRGQGINYKNFAEVIYLYNLREDRTPNENIKKAQEMIEIVKAKGIEKETDNAILATQRYINGIQEALKLSEDKFIEYIVHSYNFDANFLNVAEININMQQNTAYNNYKKILENIDNAGGSGQGLWFVDTLAWQNSEKKNNDIKNILEYSGSEDEKSAQKIMTLMESVDRYLRRPFDAVDENTISRTYLLSAYYYYYINEHIGDEERMSFNELYDDFKGSVDRILEASYYQKISPKNIYDMWVIISAYDYLRA